MAIRRAKRNRKGKKPEQSVLRQTVSRRMYDTGDYAISALCQASRMGHVQWQLRFAPLRLPTGLTEGERFGKPFDLLYGSRARNRNIRSPFRPEPTNRALGQTAPINREQVAYQVEAGEMVWIGPAVPEIARLPRRGAYVIGWD